jgi:xylulokinase
MSYFIGIDVSTTATKALLLDRAGQILEVASSAYMYETPHPLWSEQNPELWWDAAVESIREIISRNTLNAQEIQGIGLTGQMHGLVLLDQNGAALRPAILWNDQRTSAQCDEIRARIGKER